MNRRNEYEYERYRGVGHAWMYIDGLRNGGIAPKDEEFQDIDGETQEMGFGEFSEYAYLEV